MNRPDEQTYLKKAINVPNANLKRINLSFIKLDYWLARIMHQHIRLDNFVKKEQT